VQERAAEQEYYLLVADGDKGQHEQGRLSRLDTPADEKDLGHQTLARTATTQSHKMKALYCDCHAQAAQSTSDAGERDAPMQMHMGKSPAIRQQAAGSSHQSRLTWWMLSKQGFGHSRLQTCASTSPAQGRQGITQLLDSTGAGKNRLQQSYKLMLLYRIDACGAMLAHLPLIHPCHPLPCVDSTRFLREPVRELLLSL